MPFLPGQPRPAKAGRRKGTPNKVNAAFKACLLGAFHDIGGQQAMADWAADPKNRGTFYQICGRLIPTEIAGSSEPDAKPVSVHHHYDDLPK